MLPVLQSEHFLQQFKNLKEKGSHNSYLLTLAALSCGYNVNFHRSQKEADSKIKRFPADVDEPVFYSINSKRKIVHFTSSRSEHDNLKAHTLSVNKSVLKAYLSKAGINTPFGGAAKSDNRAILTSLKKAGIDRVSVKPVAGKGSRGVRLNQTLEQAEAIIAENPQDIFIVEQMIQGAEFRITASKKDVVAAHMIIPAHVVGDDITTLKDLIEQEVKLRKKNPAFVTRPLDPIKVLESAAAQGVHGSNVLKKGEIYRLTLDGLPTRAFRTPVLDRLPKQFVDIAKQTVQLIDGVVCGIDVLADRSGTPYVLDIDAVSGMWFECFPHPTGEWNLDVPNYILKHHFPKHKGTQRQILSYDFVALKEELMREGRTTKGVNAADFAVFA